MSYRLPGYPKKEQQTLDGNVYEILTAGVDVGAIYVEMNKADIPHTNLARWIDAELGRQGFPVSSRRAVLSEEDLSIKYHESVFAHLHQLYLDNRVWNAFLATNRKLIAVQPKEEKRYEV